MEVKLTSKNIWVVITGLVRKHNYFMHSLNTLLDARKKGLVDGIIFSTWDGEVDNYSGLRNFLKSNNIILSEIRSLESPTADLSHNIERQKVLLYWGVCCAPTGSYIFKTRPDQVVTINEKFHGLLEYLHVLDMSVADVDKGILQSKIWCGRLAPNIPFWFDDRYFFTSREVAIGMTTMTSDIRLIGHPNNFIAEINWYQPLFAKTTIWANAVMRVNWLTIAQRGPESSEAYKAMLRSSNFYWLSIAVYDNVARRFIEVGFPGFNLDDYEFLGPDANRAAELPIQFNRVIDFIPECQMNVAFDDAQSLCNDLVNGPINDPALWRNAIESLVLRAPQLRNEVVRQKIS